MTIPLSSTRSSKLIRSSVLATSGCTSTSIKSDAQNQRQDQRGWIGLLSSSRCSVSFTRIHVLSDANSRSVALRPSDFFILRRTCTVTIQPETVAAITAANTYNVPITSNIGRFLSTYFVFFCLAFTGLAPASLSAVTNTGSMSVGTPFNLSSAFCTSGRSSIISLISFFVPA
jgi:hypothetical protein